MQTMQPALLTGPYDWDPGKTPRAAFDARRDRATGAAAAAGATLLLVHGDRSEFGALAYLTGFVPKLGPALALFPVAPVPAAPVPDGTSPLSGAAAAPSLLFSGGPGMVDSARRLTWIEDVRALGPLGRDLAPLAGQSVALWGCDALSLTLHQAIGAAVGAAGRLLPMAEMLDPLRRRKSGTEQALIRRAGVLLAEAAASIRQALGRRQAVPAAVSSAERHAYRHGAQDFRVLASRRPGGPALPIDGAPGDPASIRPATIYLALRYGGYWAQGWLAIGIGEEVRTAAARRLAALVAASTPGSPVPDAADGCAAGIGLSLVEEPTRVGMLLVEGDALTIRLAVPLGAARAVTVSALIFVRAGRPDILWSTLPL